MKEETLRECFTILAGAISFLAEEMQRAGITDKARAADMLARLDAKMPNKSPAAATILEGLRRGMVGRS